MFGWIRRRMAYTKHSAYQPPKEAPSEPLSANLTETVITLRKKCGSTADLMTHPVQVGSQRVMLLLCEGMFNLNVITEMVIEPLTHLVLPGDSPAALVQWMRQRAILAPDQQEVHTYGEVFRLLMSGFVLVLIDGIPFGFALGMQGYPYRAVGEPSSETNERGSREGFAEPIRVNVTLIRRRLKTEALRFEMLNLGTKSHTDVCLVYLADAASPTMVSDVRARLSKVQLETILDSGYLAPFLDDKPFSLFSGVGTTERPDTFCAKITEGRVGVLVDGTPFALIVPFLFTEHFQSMDDYTHRAYYATFLRCLKYLSFFFTILIPGVYVAVSSFHPELFPEALLFNIAASEESTPFPIMAEALIIHLIFEIMREAGLRMPRPVGHAVSIVGAIVIGDAAVTAGLIGAPMVMVVALTAISSFVVPSLYEPVSILRILFILLGGTFGIYGITLALVLVFVNLAAINGYGVPVTSPAAPFSLYTGRDTLLRLGWQKLGRQSLRVQHLPGSELDDEKEGPSPC